MVETPQVTQCKAARNAATNVSALLGYADRLAAPAGGLGVLALDAQAPVMPQTAVIAARPHHTLVRHTANLKEHT